MCSPRALTEVKEPSGGLDSPSSFSPQHSAEPSVLSPQVFDVPALTEVKEPSGGLDSPFSFDPPTLDRAVRPHSTCVVPSTADGEKVAGGGNRLSEVIVVVVPSTYPNTPLSRRSSLRRYGPARR